MNYLRGHAMDEMKVLEEQLGFINDGLLSETGNDVQYVMFWKGYYKEEEVNVMIEVQYIEDWEEFLIEPWFQIMGAEDWEAFA